MEMMIGGKTREVLKIRGRDVMSVLETLKNILLLGASGYGKTAKVEAYAVKHGLRIAYVDLAGQLPESIAGIPAAVMTKDETTGYYRRMLDVEWQEFLECEGEGWLLFFDEINQGSPEALNTLYSITHPNPDMRRWAGHRISKCQIVACGNLSDGTDGTVYLTEIPTPLVNRFFVFELIPDRKDTKDILKKKWSNLPLVTKYLDVLLDEDVPPRDIDLCLEVLACDITGLLLQAKIGEALTKKLYEIKEDVKSIDPLELMNRVKEIYDEFKDKGCIEMDSKMITTEEELKDMFIGMLTEEEIASIFGTSTNSTSKGGE